MEGVSYYNDSKGTNVGSVAKSLQSFQEPVILIAGGKDKNTDLHPLKELIQGRVRRMILIGEAKERMAREFGSLTDTVMAGTLEEAVLLAHREERWSSSHPPVRVSICSRIIKKGERCLRRRCIVWRTLHERKRKI
jgi:UDP-N-acetylmuramoylalanine-D-glutamate ligase